MYLVLFFYFLINVLDFLRAPTMRWVEMGSCVFVCVFVIIFKGKEHHICVLFYFLNQNIRFLADTDDDTGPCAFCVFVRVLRERNITYTNVSDCFFF